MKTWKKVIAGIGFLVIAVSLTACGEKKVEKEAVANKDLKEFVVGVCPGPYGDMTEQVISPLMEKKGYKLTTKLFNDYVQPNKALASGNIEANLFQHTSYLEKFSEDNKLDLTAVGMVPTLGMGIYSKEVKKLSDLKENTIVSIPSDASNLARALQLLAVNGLIEIKADIDETKATVDDIAANPKKLEIKTLDAAQLSRSLDNVDIALVPGNFAWAAKLKPSEALALEKLAENYKNVFVVRNDELDGKFAKAVKEVLASQEFREAIAKSDFKEFDQPESWKE